MTQTARSQLVTYTLDPAHSEVGFAVKHLMVTNVKGSFHKFDAQVQLDEADLTNSKLSVTIDASSIDTRNADRDAHLRSPDFFDVEKNPNLTFVSKRIDRMGDDSYKVVGDLTIRGVTREVTLDAEETGRGKDPWGNSRIGFELRGKINREEYGLLWNQALETGGVLVAPDVKLVIDIEVIRAA